MDSLKWARTPTALGIKELYPPENTKTLGVKKCLLIPHPLTNIHTRSTPVSRRFCFPSVYILLPERIHPHVGIMSTHHEGDSNNRARAVPLVLFAVQGTSTIIARILVRDLCFHPARTKEALAETNLICQTHH